MKLNIFISVSCAIFLFASCSKKQDSTDLSEKAAINETFLAQVKTAKAVLSNQEEELTLSGKVEYDPDKVVYYVPLISGIVEKSYFSLGDKVQKGQTLLDIRSADLSVLWSDYISYESETEVAKRELQSAQAMYDDKMLSEKELLEAKSKLKQALASFERVKGDIAMYENKGNGLFAIKSPMNGYIVQKKAASGSPVTPDGNPLFVVADLSNVWITANVYAGDLLFVKEGMDAKITTLSYPDEMFSGKISSLSQVFDPDEKVLKARIQMPNGDLKFKPEMSVVVKLRNEVRPEPITNHETTSGNSQLRMLVSVPSDAIIFDDNKYFVVVEKSAGEFQIREVSIQGHHEKTTYIRQGLTENENVVVENQLLIYEGMNGK